jgi:hypothetical protein
MVNALVEPSFVSLAREIVKKKTAQYVNGCDCSLAVDFDEKNCENVILLDMQSANLITSVYDAINPKNKSSFEERMRKLGVVEFIQRLWRLTT